MASSRSIDESPDEDVAFTAEVIRLQGELREVGRRLDQIEVEMRWAVKAIARRRFEERC